MPVEDPDDLAVVGFAELDFLAGVLFLAVLLEAVAELLLAEGALAGDALAGIALLAALLEAVVPPEDALGLLAVFAVVAAFGFVSAFAFLLTAGALGFAAAVLLLAIARFAGADFEVTVFLILL